MKEATVKVSGKILNSAKNYSLKVIFAKTMYFISSLLISRGCILGSCYPFGLSLSAAVSSKGLIPTMIGSVLGYFLPLKLYSGMRYISTLIAISAIKWTLSDFKKIINHSLYVPLVVFISSLVTGLAVNCSDGLDQYGLYLTVIECLVAGSAAYFFEVSFKILSNKKLYSLNYKELACIAISVGISLLSLSTVSILGISPGRVMGILIILCASYAVGVVGGTLTGVALGIVFSLPSFGLVYISGSYAFAGMISGIFSSLGRLGIGIAFLFSSFLISLRCGDFSQMIGGLYESIIAAAIFILIPKPFFNKIKSCIPSGASPIKYDGMREALMQRLRLVSTCLASMTGCVDKTISSMNDLASVSYKDTCFNSVKNYCQSCSLNSFCWDRNKESTYKYVNDIISKAEIKNESNSFNLMPRSLKYCNKYENIFNQVSGIIKDFSVSREICSQSIEFKKKIEEQFLGISYLLNDLTFNFGETSFFDDTLLENIKSFLSKNNILVESISCKKSRGNKIFIEMEIPISSRNKFNSKLIREISKLCGRSLDVPIMEIIEGICRVQICELKTYTIDFSVSQHACNGGNFCGDSCRCFEDGEGRFNVVVSDGMGTGGSAAVEGSLTSELIKKFLKCGINFDSAVRIVNSVMLLNHNDESLVALDVISVDLFTGEAKFMKAGSPASFVVRGGEVRKINFSSLPVGILKDVSFSCKSVNLDPGDWVIMVSDGITDIGEQWVMNVLNNMNYTTPGEISKYLVSKAVEARETTHDDDITVAVFQMQRRK